ncbi:DUF305 domain-containing protein [Leifsonia sp. H3M29-4]|uniref:DUF305 domain-containing protein n=1 Tax=Salinibacterium metalliresistens TaxID=3031321 RepID=UPI0023DCD592|nr:DUF305 domain-containing protein [Salinibacterium metalliresistens]MDF1479718.1 DUF305 domain-containing protein [Salinibacterium metalliresistens]
MRFRTIALASGALITTVLVLTGCAQSSTTGAMPGMDHGSTPMTPSESTSDVNFADQTFVTMMIPHHEQAVEMADLVLGKDGIDERVSDLAQQIKDAQGPEIETMKSWLSALDTPYDSSETGGMNHGGGMMSDDDMAALESATGVEASRLFLEQMILHHQGAIDMAQTELITGQNADALALAQTIIDAQAAEIATMQNILGTL